MIANTATTDPCFQRYLDNLSSGLLRALQAWKACRCLVRSCRFRVNNPMVNWPLHCYLLLVKKKKDEKYAFQMRNRHIVVVLSFFASQHVHNEKVVKYVDSLIFCWSLIRMGEDYPHLSLIDLPKYGITSSQLSWWQWGWRSTLFHNNTKTLWKTIGLFCIAQVNIWQKIQHFGNILWLMW